MRVLLINPWEGEVFPTPAIGYLQAVIKSTGVDVKAIDMPLAWSEKDDYDLVAVTFHSFSVKHAIQIRQHFKGRLVCGGHHPSAIPDQMLAVGYNQVVIGEGEKAIVDILNGNTSDKIQGGVSDIDSIPFPDYTGLGGDWTMGLPIISSRGCPFSCNFCASSNFWGRRYRARSADNVLSEIEKRKREGYTTWMFEDDNFTANRKRVFDICDGLNGTFGWQCASRAESLDDELCHRLRQAGCNVIWLGIESLSQDSLDRCGKNTTVEKMLRGIDTADRHGIQTMSQFIVGLPGDTLRDIQITHKNRMASKIKRYGWNFAWVLPGTEIHKKAIEYGFNDDYYLEHGVPFYTYEHDFETLTNWANQI
jgi:radical SAM superfamily enzyme YgiQ (UPF0313 family)